MLNPLKKDTIEEKLEKIINTQIKETMSEKIPHDQEKLDLNKNSSSIATENSDSANVKKYLGISSDNKPMIYSIEDFNAKTSAITKLFENTEQIVKLLKQADSVLYKYSYGKPYIITPKELLSKIKTGLLSGDLKWNIKQYPSAFNQFSYYIRFQTRDTYKNEEKYYKTEGLVSIEDSDIYDAKFFSTFGVEYDVNGKLHTYSSRKEFDNFNRLLAIDNWLRKYGSEQDRNIITLFKNRFKREEIAKIYGIDVIEVYDLFRRIKYYFKNHPIR